MRNLRLLDVYRITDSARLKWCGGWAGDETVGAFSIPSCIDRAELKVIASAGEGWDHVSVSRRNRCPNWDEMEQIASLFFKPDEAAFQLHVPAGDHINNMPTCLHWWRPLGQDIPRPPGWMVGTKGVTVADMATMTDAEVMRLRDQTMETGR